MTHEGKRTRRHTASIVAHGIPTVGLFLQGLLYVTTDTFMPYHADALVVTWEALPRHYQGFLLGVIKAMGAGSIAVTAALSLMLLIPFRRGETWARWAVPLVGITFTTLTAYAAYTIDVGTPAAPPWRLTGGLGGCTCWAPPSRIGLRAVPPCERGSCVARGRSRWHWGVGVAALVAFGATSRVAGSQELEPRAFSPSPVGTTFVLSALGTSEGGVLFDPALNIENVQADLWIATLGVGHTFPLAGRQARALAVLPVAWGSVTGAVQAQPQRQELTGLVDPRFKISVGLIGTPALSVSQFGAASRRTAVGVAVTVVPPWGQYDARQLVNLGFNRWAMKPELGLSHPIGGWTLDASAGVWLFGTNRAYYPGHAVRRQDAILALQGNASYSLPRVRGLPSTPRGSRAARHASMAC